MTIHHGDCLDVMAGLEPESIDAICTDPPYGLSFMGKEWDSLTKVPAHIGPQWGGYGWHGTGPTDPMKSQAWHQRWAEAAYRVAKPSAYLLAFGGTRTVHRMTVALEDAGWIIRDMLVWAYASGFPKSKASLKPAWEPIVMARKPGPLRMLAIDECRIGTGGDKGEWPSTERSPSIFADGAKALTDQSQGRWPANVILTDPIFDGGVEGVVGGGETATATAQPGRWDQHMDKSMFALDSPNPTFYGDSGTYSRFFLIPKADRSDREPVLGGQLAERSGHFAQPNGKRMGRSAEEGGGVREATARANHHPTVKPTELMRHLVRLVTPPGGTVLDPFLGSGTTGLACELEGFPWLGIEKEAEYVAIAEARLNGTQRGLGLAG